jgi:hypothetical protein
LGSVITALSGSGAAASGLTGAFAERPFYNADADLDEAKCIIRRKQLGFTDEYVQAMKLPPLDPYEYECALAMATDKDLKPDYPGSLDFIDMKKIERQYTAQSEDVLSRHNFQMSALMASGNALLTNGKSDGTFEDVDDEYEGEEDMDENVDGQEGEDEEEDIRGLIAERYKNVIAAQQQQQALPPPPPPPPPVIDPPPAHADDDEGVEDEVEGGEQDNDDGDADMYVEQTIAETSRTIFINGKQHVLTLDSEGVMRFPNIYTDPVDATQLCIDFAEDRLSLDDYLDQLTRRGGSFGWFVDTIDSHEDLGRNIVVTCKDDTNYEYTWCHDDEEIEGQ